MQLLETVDVAERLELALGLQRERLTLMQMRRRIRDDVNTGMEKQQREYILRKQLESIRKELGEDETSVVEEFRTKIAESAMPDHVREQAERELGRFERMGESSPEAQTIRSYLDWLLAVPWGVRSEERLDPQGDARGARRRPRRPRGRQGPHRRVHRGAQAPRGAGHRAGQEVRRDPDPDRAARHRQDVDRRVHRPLAQPRVRPHVARRHPRRGGDPGPPAHVHRRAPGRLVRALRDAKTMNPVILLDEVDKVGADWRGDPSAALLEVLDPAQNSTFRDHYLDVELDLSEVIFIATANQAETIPGPLLDRMEVIRFDGYTTDEKVAIATRLPVAAAARAQRPPRGRGDRRRRGARDGDLRVHA